MHTTPQNTKVLVIASSVDFFAGHDGKFANRNLIRTQLVDQSISYTGFTTNICTGALNHLHCVPTNLIVDSQSLKLRLPLATDRKHPAFWESLLQHNIHTCAIDWPASDGDQSIENLVEPRSIRKTPIDGNPDLDFANASSLLSDQDIHSPKYQNSCIDLAVAIHNIEKAITHTKSTSACEVTALSLPVKLDATLPGSPSREYVKEKLEALAYSLSEDTVILFAAYERPEEHAPKSGTTEKSKNPHSQRTLTIIGGNQNPNQVKNSVSIRAISSVIHALCGVPTPIGSLQHSWPFLSTTKSTKEALFPPSSNIQDDYKDITLRLLETKPTDDSSNESKRSYIRTCHIHSKRIHSLLLSAHYALAFKESIELSETLIAFRGLPIDHWLHIQASYAINTADFCTACDTFHTAYPDNPMAQLSMALKYVSTNKDTSAELLDTIDPDTLHPASIGEYGRLLIQLNKVDAGIIQLQKIIGTRHTLPIDYFKLTKALLHTGSPESALSIFTRFNIGMKPIKKQLLHAEILFSLNELEQCIQVCENVLAASPTEEKALDHIAKCRARLSHPE